MSVAYRRIYDSKVKKFLLGTGIPLGIGFIWVLVTLGAITVTGFSGDAVCRGDEMEPCYAYVNFTANTDVFLYINDITWFDINKSLDNLIIQRSWGKGWRTINTEKGCTGSWCGKLKSDTRPYATYSYAFRAGRNYSLRFIGYKKDLTDTIKWTFGDWKTWEPADPVWESDKRDRYLKITGSRADLSWAYTNYTVCNPTEFKYLSGMSLDWEGDTENLKKCEVRVRENKTISLPKHVYYEKEVCRKPYANETEAKGDICWNKTLVNETMVQTKQEGWIIWNGTVDPQLSAVKSNCEDVQVYCDLYINTDLSKVSIDHIPTVFGHTYPEYDFWNTSWTRRKNLDINTSTAVSDIPVAVNITYDSDMLSDFRDIRITNNCSANAVTLNIDNETHIASKWVYVWINISEYSLNHTFCMYYGNPTANHLWAPDDVWEFYEPFDGLNVGELAGQGSWSVTTGDYMEVNDTTTYKGNKSLENTGVGNGDADNNIGVVIPVGRLVGWMYVTSGFADWDLKLLESPDTSHKIDTRISTSNDARFQTGNPSRTWTEYSNTVINTWYRFNIKWINHTWFEFDVNWSYNGVGVGEMIETYSSGLDTIRIRNNDAGAPVFIDSIRMGAAYAENQTDPIYAFGPEENPSDTTVPKITIFEPWNVSYNNNSIDFNITGNELLDWVVVEIEGYNSSNFTNQSGEWNYFNGTLSNGSHNVSFWFNDTAGNMNHSGLYWFSIDDIAAPTTTSPDDASYGQGAGADVSWTLTDNIRGGYYEILINSTVENTSIAWTSPDTITTWVNTTTQAVGEQWNYTIFFNDSVGNDGISDEVLITIEAVSMDKNVTGDIEYGYTVNFNATAGCITDFYNADCSSPPELNLNVYPALYSFQGGSNVTIAPNETVVFEYNNKSIYVLDVMLNLTPETTSLKDITIDVLNDAAWDAEFLGTMYAKGRMILNETNESSHPFNITDGVGVFYIQLSSLSNIEIANITIGNLTPSQPVTVDAEKEWSYNGILFDPQQCVDEDFDTYASNAATVTNIFENFSIPDTVVEDSIGWAGKFTADKSVYAPGAAFINISVFWYNWTGSSWDLKQNCYDLTPGVPNPCQSLEWSNISIPTGVFVNDNIFSQRVELMGSYYSSITLRYYESRINYTLTAPVNVEIDTLNDGTNETYIAELSDTNTYELNMSGIQTYLSDKNTSFSYVPVSITYSPRQVNISVKNITINYTIYNVSLNITAIRERTPINNTISVRFNWSGNNMIVNDLFSPYQGNGNITVFQYTPGAFNRLENISADVYYSNFSVDLPTNVYYPEFISLTNTSKNVTPWGQAADTPIYNITALGYNKPMNFTMYVNESYNACMNITISNTSTKYGGKNWVLNTTASTMFSDMSENQTAGIWIWADFYNCPNRWLNWYPEIVSVCTTCVGGW